MIPLRNWVTPLMMVAFLLTAVTGILMFFGLDIGGEGDSPQSPGTWSWGGAWGHSWFVDPVLPQVVVALTNTAAEGMLGKFTLDVRDAVYA
jgi:CubicO group peptidase (beta-lactamase class C family)